MLEVKTKKKKKEAVKKRGLNWNKNEIDYFKQPKRKNKFFSIKSKILTKKKRREQTHESNFYIDESSMPTANQPQWSVITALIVIEHTNWIEYYFDFFLLQHHEINE